MYPNLQAENMAKTGNYDICKKMPIMPTPMLAHAYVPFQQFANIYPPMKGLAAGTIFPELDRPYGVDPEYTFDA